MDVGNRFYGAVFTTLFALGFVSFGAHAQAVTTEAEGSTRAKTDDALSGQGDRSIGDMVDLNTGSLSFSQTDVSIPGNNALTVALTRRFDAQRVRALNNSTSSQSFYDWQIDIPRITVTLGTARPGPPIVAARAGRRRF